MGLTPEPCILCMSCKFIRLIHGYGAKTSKISYLESELDSTGFFFLGGGLLSLPNDFLFPAASCVSDIDL